MLEVAMDSKQYLANLQVPEGRVDAVLDTDTYNEIDDQFALSYMFLSPEKFNLKAIYAAPFFNSHSTSPKDGMERSYDEIMKLLGLLNRNEYVKNVYKGSVDYLIDETTAQESEAARHLVALAAEYSPERPLYVVAIGAITNVASALIMDPSIAEKIVIVWLGGHSLEYCDNKEFNLHQDIAAARVVFKSEAPLVQLPCQGVVSGFATTKPELKEWLMNENDRFMLSRVIPVRLPGYDGCYEEETTDKLFRYVYFIKRDALFEDLFKKLALN